jgi:hypothetical protein
VRSYGSGKLIFTHLRILDKLGENPVADRLFVNFLRHFSRRSVPSGSLLPVHQAAVEWLRRERLDHVRKWQVIGPLAGQSAPDSEAYLPEREGVVAGMHAGIYGPVQWRAWHTSESGGLVIDLNTACNPAPIAFAGPIPGLYYAYAEFNVDRRVPATVELGSDSQVEAWLNGRAISRIGFEDTPTRDRCSVLLRQGRNTLVIKLLDVGRGAAFSLELTADDPSVQPSWWK